MSTSFWKQKFVEITQQCFALLPQVNFHANNLNFHWRCRWWDWIQDIYWNLFYFKKQILEKKPISSYFLSNLGWWTKKNHQENSHLSHQRVSHFSRDSLATTFDNETFCRHCFCIQTWQLCAAMMSWVGQWIELVVY